MRTFIRNLVATGKLQAAVELLLSDSDPDVVEQAALLSFRLAELTRKEREGTEAEPVLAARRAQLAQSVLDLSAGLEPASPPVRVAAAPVATPSQAGNVARERPVPIFITYAHADGVADDPSSPLSELRAHLAPIVREGLVEVWADTSIEYGQRWHPTITAAIERAQLAILLVSPRLLASDYVAEHELPQLLQRHHAGHLRLVPVLLERSDLHASYRFTDQHGEKQTVMLSSLQFVNADKPLSSLSSSERQGVWLAVVRSIRSSCGDPAA